MKFIIPIAPTPAVRITQGTRWNARSQMYLAWKRDCAWLAKIAGATIIPNDAITFRLKIPASRKELKPGMPHEQKPDLDNLIKAVFDALHANDAHIYALGKTRKEWATVGEIEIRRKED